MNLERNSLVFPVLVLLVLGASSWGFYVSQIKPLQTRDEEGRAKVEAVQDSLRSARTILRKLQGEERQAAGALATLDRQFRDQPASPPIVWFPGTVSTHFRGFNLPDLQVRLLQQIDENGLPGCVRFLWKVSIDLPNESANSKELLFAVAELQRREPLLRISEFEFGQKQGSPDQKTALLKLSILTRPSP